MVQLLYPAQSGIARPRDSGVPLFAKSLYRVDGRASDGQTCLQGVLFPCRIIVEPQYIT